MKILYVGGAHGFNVPMAIASTYNGEHTVVSVGKPNKLKLFPDVDLVLYSKGTCFASLIQRAGTVLDQYKKAGVPILTVPPHWKDCKDQVSEAIANHKEKKMSAAVPVNGDKTAKVEMKAETKTEFHKSVLEDFQVFIMACYVDCIATYPEFISMSKESLIKEFIDYMGYYSADLSEVRKFDLVAYRKKVLSPLSKSITQQAQENFVRWYVAQAILSSKSLPTMLEMEGHLRPAFGYLVRGERLRQVRFEFLDQIGFIDFCIDQGVINARTRALPKLRLPKFSFLTFRETISKEEFDILTECATHGWWGAKKENPTTQTPEVSTKVETVLPVAQPAEQKEETPVLSQNVPFQSVIAPPTATLPTVTNPTINIGDLEDLLAFVKKTGMPISIQVNGVIIELRWDTAQQKK